MLYLWTLWIEEECEQVQVINKLLTLFIIEEKDTRKWIHDKHNQEDDSDS